MRERRNFKDVDFLRSAGREMYSTAATSCKVHHHLVIIILPTTRKSNTA